MIKLKSGWHNPKKKNKLTTQGKCPYCNKNVESLEDHILDKHREKFVKKK